MEIRKEILRNKGEIDFFTQYGYRLSLRGTDKDDVYELYERLFREEKDVVIVKGSLEDCVVRGNVIGKEVYEDWEDDTIAKKG